MKESILQQKAFNFASNIVLFYEKYSKIHKDNTISKQLLRRILISSLNTAKNNK